MKKVVGGALFRNGKLLVVKRTNSRKFWPGIWEIPGGKVEGSETDVEALQREFLEETHLKINVIRKFYTFRYIYVDEPAEENDYIVKSDNFEVKIDPEEHTEHRWVTKGEFKNLETSPDMRKSIEKAFGMVAQPGRNF